LKPQKRDRKREWYSNCPFSRKKVVKRTSRTEERCEPELQDEITRKNETAKGSGRVSMPETRFGTKKEITGRKMGDYVTAGRHLGKGKKGGGTA